MARKASEKKIREVENRIRAALTSIRNSFLKTKEECGDSCPKDHSDLAVDIRVHRNSDDSIDGQVTIEDIPRGLDVSHLTFIAEQGALREKGIWISNGMRFAEDKHFPEMHDYNRWKGLYQTQTFYQDSGEDQEVLANFATGRDVLGWLADRGRRKPEQYFVRYHWNPYDKKPVRGNPTKHRYYVPKKRPNKKSTKKKGGKK